MNIEAKCFLLRPQLKCKTHEDELVGLAVEKSDVGTEVAETVYVAGGKNWERGITVRT